MASDIRYRIRDWDIHFERDRTKQWKHLQWVPIPSKQGAGYRTIMAEENGTAIFGCWIALVEQGSQCTPRGDLLKYDMKRLSLLTMISESELSASIKFLTETLDWVEVIDVGKTNLDVSVNHLDNSAGQSAIGSSILFSSIQSSSEKEYYLAFRKEYPDKCSAIAPETTKEIAAAVVRDGGEVVIAGVRGYAAMLKKHPGYQFTMQAYNFLSKSAYMRDWEAVGKKWAEEKVREERKKRGRYQTDYPEDTAEKSPDEVAANKRLTEALARKIAADKKDLERRAEEAGIDGDESVIADLTRKFSKGMK